MKKRMSVLFGIIVITIIVIGCGGNDDSTEGHLAQKVMDTVAMTVAENIQDAIIEPTDQPIKIEPLNEQTAPEGSVRYGQLLLDGTTLYAVSDEGLIVKDIENNTERIVKAEDGIRAIVKHNDELFAGGASLYKLTDEGLEFVDDEFEGEITTLYSFYDNLMIGTDFALYSKSHLGKDLIMEDKSVSALAADDNDGLWIGTFGEGLYRWDGMQINQRYLRRDTTLFDTVLTLAFNHNHLYMGTVNGLHVFDGGRWTTLTEADGLPSNRVTTVDAEGWIIYAGTDDGVVSFFKDEISPVDKLEGKIVNDIVRNGRELLVATDFDGVIQKGKNSVNTLLPPILNTNVQFLSLVF